jgi:hypothetical protein
MLAMTSSLQKLENVKGERLRYEESTISIIRNEEILSRKNK